MDLEKGAERDIRRRLITPQAPAVQAGCLVRQLKLVKGSR